MPKEYVKASKRILDALREVRAHVLPRVLNRAFVGRQNLSGWFLITDEATLYLGPNKNEAIRTLMDMTPELWAALEPRKDGSRDEQG